MNNLIENILSVVGSRVVSNAHTSHSSSTPSTPSEMTWMKPSTVNWCEQDYVITSNIAEFFNTFSSFAMIISGLVGIYLHRHNLERRFLVSFATVAVVGIGSSAFHATLLFSLQMLDELPMIYSALAMTYSIIEQRSVKKKYKYLPLALIFHGILTTFLVASPILAPQYSSPRLQFICFHISFALLEFNLLYQVFKMAKTSSNEQSSQVYHRGIWLWIAGLFCWIVDYLGCDLLLEGKDSMRVKYLTFNLFQHHFTVPNPQLHSWWHICASSGLYLMSIFVAAERCEYLGYIVNVKYHKYFLLPYIETIPTAKSKSMLKIKNTIDSVAYGEIEKIHNRRNDAHDEILLPSTSAANQAEKKDGSKQTRKRRQM